MLLRDDAVLLDLREDRVIGEGHGKKDTYVHGDRVYDAGEPASAPTALRLARHQDWRAFRRDLPELLKQISANDFAAL